MNFLNPFALFGLFAASIPVILHLLNLRKLKQIEFSSLKFLKELQKNKIRRLKMRQIILLILRTALIIFAVLSFSAPVIKSSLPFAGTYTKTSAIILIDNSLSMDVSDGGGNRLNRAKKYAEEIASSLRDGDEAAVIALSDPDISENLSFTRNTDFIREQIANIKPKNSVSYINNGLRLAGKLLASSSNLNKEVYIISDAKKNSLSPVGTDTLKLFGADIGLFFVPVGAEYSADIPNAGIDSVNVVSKIFDKDKPVEVEFTVHNYSSKPLSGVSAGMYFNDARVAQRMFDLPAGESKTVSIAAPPQSDGVNRGYIELDPDGMESDNKRFFGFIVPGRPNVLIAGTGSSSEFVKIVCSALNNRGETRINAETCTPGELGSRNLDGFDAVILAGGPYRASDLSAFENYVKKGGSGILYADFATDKPVFNSALTALGFGVASEQSFGDENPGVFTKTDRTHPLFEGVFTSDASERDASESPAIKKALPVGGGRGIIDMPGGYFLSESSAGEGRVIYIAVSADNYSGNFPLTPLFPVLNYRSVFYLASPRDISASVLAGGSVNITLPKKFAGGGNFDITDPSGSVVAGKAVVFPGGASVGMNYLDMIGTYVIKSGDGRPAAVFSVNQDPSESDLSGTTSADIEKSLSISLDPSASIKIIDNPSELMKSIDRARTGTELWQPLLLLAILTALAEMLVARIGKKDTE